MLEEAVKLEYKMKKEDLLVYKTTVHSIQEIKSEEQSGKTYSDVEMKMAQKCSNIDKDGILTVDMTIQSGKLLRDGESANLPNIGQTITLKMKNNGEIVHASVDLPFEQPAFPDKKVKKGETWTGQSKISIPGKSEMATLNYNYLLWDFKKVQGYECSEIKVSCPETRIPLGEGIEQVLTANGTTYFAHNDGRLVKSEVNTDTKITAQDGTVFTEIRVIVELEEKRQDLLSSPDEMYIIK
jgi:hypothetical protein